MNRGTLEYVVALDACQPATCKLVGITRGHKEATASSVLVKMLKKGLATRYKRDPLEDAPLSEKERMGLEVYRVPCGKRPYLYELTPAGKRLAHYLAPALTILNELENQNEKCA